MLSGLEYYVTPLAERPFAELHERFKPSGVAGHGFGVLGTAMLLVGVVMYTARKRWRLLSRLGKLKHWLEVHIFLCTLGPFLVLLHTTFKFGGIVSIACGSMAAVVVSGVVGRYVYVRIPKTVNGRFLTLQAVEGERDRLLQDLEARSGLRRNELAPALMLPPLPKPRTLPGALVAAVHLDIAARSRWRRVRRLLREHGVAGSTRLTLLRLAREQLRRQQQIFLLHPFQLLFRYWHLFHLPLAIVMFVIVVLHVAVAAAFGYAWTF